MSGNPQTQGLFDPAREAWNFMKFILFLCRRQLVVFMHWGHGARAFSFPVNFLTQLMIALAAATLGGVGMSLYATLYTILSLIHLGYRLSLTEDQHPHTKYDGTPHLLGWVIPQVEFSKKKYPVWFPEDSEIAIKIGEPLLFTAIGYVIADAGETKLGLYLMFVGLGSLGSVFLARMEMMDEYYDKLDMLNQMRYDQTPSEEKKHHKGFKYAKPGKTEITKPQGLTEDELKAKIQDIEARTRKPQAPTAEEDQAIGKDKTSSAITTGEVIIFDENDVAPASNAASNNGNGSSPIATTATVRAVKPPKAKTHPK